MVGSTPDLGSIYLESRGIPLTPRPQSSPEKILWRSCSSRASLKSAPGSLNSDLNASSSITKIAHILCQRAREKQNDLRRAFETIDKDRNMAITKGEFRKVIERFLLPLNSKQFQDLLAKIPINSDGTVPYTVFLEKFCSPDESQIRRANSRTSSIVSNCNLTPRQIENYLRDKILNNLKNIIRAFKLFDYNKDEHIQCYELRRVLESYCLRMTDSQFERLCSRHHLSRMGAVNYMQFLAKLGIPVEPSNKRSTECVAQAMNWEDGVQVQEKQPKLERPMTEESLGDLASLSRDEIEWAFRKKLQANYHNLLQAFSNYDVSKSGFILMGELQAVFNKFICPSNEVFGQIMERYKIEPNGKVGWNQFLLSSPDSMPTEEKWALPKHQPNNSLSSCHYLNPGGLCENKKNTDLLQKLHKYFRERYPAGEENHNGIITRQELRRILQCFPFRLIDEEIKTLMLLLDPEHSGYFHCNQLMELAEEKKNQNLLNGTKNVKKTTPVAAVWQTVEDILCDKIRTNWDEIQKCFLKSDPEKTGKISLAELRRVMETHCLPISDQHFEKLCKQQRTNSLHISYQQFLENLGLTDMPKNTTTEVSALNQQQQRLIKKENEDGVLGKTMSLNDVKSELWLRIIYCDSNIRKSFLTHKNQCSGKINKEGFKKVLLDCGMTMDELQFNILANILGFKNQDLNFYDFSERFKDYRSANPAIPIKQCPNEGPDWKMKRTIADDCFHIILEKVKHSSLDLRTLFDQLDRNRDGLITMYDFRTLLDNCPLTIMMTEYHRFLEMLGLQPDSKLSYLEFLRIIRVIETKLGLFWNKAAYSSRDDADNTFQLCEQVHEYLAHKAKTKWHEMIKGFHRIDSEGNLIVHKKDVRDLLCRPCWPISPKQFETFWSWYDPDNKGQMTYFEFLQKLRSRFGSHFQTDKKQIAPEAKINLMDESSEQHAVHADSTQKQKVHTGKFDIYELRKQLKAKFRDHHKGFIEIFSKLDKCNDGSITISDFQSVLKDYNYQLGQDQLRHLLLRLEIPLHNNKFSYSHFLRAIEGVEDKTKNGLKLAFIPRENSDVSSQEKTIAKLKGMVVKSYAALFKGFKSFDREGSGKINSLAFRQVLNNVCFRMTDREFSYLLSKLKSDTDHMVDWLDFLQTCTVYKAAEVPDRENHTARPKSSPQLSVVDIMSHMREVVNKCLYLITQEFEDTDYANIKVISKKNFKEIFSKHFMSISDEQFENLWNHLPVNDYGNLEYHKFLKQFSGQEPLEVKTSRTPSPAKTPSASRSSSAQSCKTPASAESNEKSIELSQRLASATPFANCEAIEQRLKKDVMKFWKEIQRECREKDTEKQGEIDAADFQAILKKFCISVKPEEFQQLVKKYESKNTGNFTYNEFIQHLVLSMGQLETNPLQRMRIPHPKVPMSPGTEHDALTQLMMRIQPCITKCWKLMRRTFKAYDETGSGYLALYLFRQVLQQYGINLSEEEFYYLSSYYDKHLQGTISYNEFLRVFL